MGDRHRRARAGRPAHHRGAGQRGRRAGDRAGEPRAAGGDRRASRTAATWRAARSSPGRLAGLAGDYPVSVEQPVRAQDVPGALARAWHEAVAGRGPALVDRAHGRLGRSRRRRPELAAPAAVLRPRTAADASDVAELAGLAGRGARARRWWSAPTRTTRDAGPRWSRWPSGSAAPVWQESFAARAGFPQDHPLFAGHLPAGARPAARGAGRPRRRARGRRAGLPPVPLSKQGPLVEPGHDAWCWSPTTSRTRTTARSELAVRRRARRRVLRRARRSGCRPATRTAPPAARAARAAAPPGDGEPLRAAHVMAALAERLPADAVVVEETPSSRPDLHPLLPARAPLGFLSAAMGGLGFALPAAIGCGWRRRAGRSSPWSATARRCTGSRRCGAPRTTLRRAVRGARQRPLRGDGPPRRAARRRQGAVAGVRGGQHRRRWRSAWAARRRRVETHDDLLKVLDDVVPTPGRAAPSRSCSRSRWCPRPTSTPDARIPRRNHDRARPRDGRASSTRRTWAGSLFDGRWRPAGDGRPVIEPATGDELGHGRRWPGRRTSRAAAGARRAGPARVGGDAASRSAPAVLRRAGELCQRARRGDRAAGSSARPAPSRRPRPSSRPTSPPQECYEAAALPSQPVRRGAALDAAAAEPRPPRPGRRGRRDRAVQRPADPRRSARSPRRWRSATRWCSSRTRAPRSAAA